MSVIRTRSLLPKLLYDFRHVVFLMLIYATEMTVWAVLNLKGLGDQNFVNWRICLLVSMVLIVLSGSAYYGSDEAALTFAGALAPWVIAPVVITVYGFIQMNLHFLSIDWFFICVLASFLLQFMLVLMSRYF